MKKVLVASLIGMALASACASNGGPHHARRGDGVVRLVPLGGLDANAYGLAYQTCAQTGLQGVAGDAGTTSVQPQVVADAYASASFTPKARPFASRGCDDALSGRSATPPTKPASK